MRNLLPGVSSPQTAGPAHPLSDSRWLTVQLDSASPSAPLIGGLVLDRSVFSGQFLLVLDLGWRNSNCFKWRASSRLFEQSVTSRN